MAKDVDDETTPLACITHLKKLCNDPELVYENYTVCIVIEEREKKKERKTRCDYCEGKVIILKSKELFLLFLMYFRIYLKSFQLLNQSYFNQNSLENFNLSIRCFLQLERKKEIKW